MDAPVSKAHVTPAEASKGAHVPVIVAPEMSLKAAMGVTVPERPVPLEVNESSLPLAAPARVKSPKPVAAVFRSVVKVTPSRLNSTFDSPAI